MRRTSRASTFRWTKPVTSVLTSGWFVALTTATLRSTFALGSFALTSPDRRTTRDSQKASDHYGRGLSAAGQQCEGDPMGSLSSAEVVDHLLNRIGEIDATSG